MAGSALLIVAAALAVVGCARPRRNAIGAAKQVVVFADTQTWEYYGEALAAIFERRVNMPREELIFEVRQQDLESWDFFRRYKHVVLCASLEDGTPAAARINDLLTPEARETVRQQSGGISIERVDLFAPSPPPPGRGSSPTSPAPPKRSSRATTTTIPSTFWSSSTGNANGTPWKILFSTGSSSWCGCPTSTGLMTAGPRRASSG